MNGIAPEWRTQEIRMLHSIVWSQRCNEQISTVGGIAREWFAANSPFNGFFFCFFVVLESLFPFDSRVQMLLKTYI